MSIIENLLSGLNAFANRCRQFLNTFTGREAERIKELDAIKNDAIDLLASAGATIDQIEEVVNDDMFNAVTAHAMVEAKIRELNNDMIDVVELEVDEDALKKLKGRPNKELLDEINKYSGMLKLDELNKILMESIQIRVKLVGYSGFYRKPPGGKRKTVKVKPQVKRKLIKLRKNELENA